MLSPSAPKMSFLSLMAVVVVSLLQLVHCKTVETSQADQARVQARRDHQPWDREDLITANDINFVHPNRYKSQQSYVCGRAIASNKNKDSILRDQNYQMAVSRPRYRPFEIRMPRIIGGDETLPGEFPWTVSVKLNGQPICGGSLIDRSWILTAAHCVVGYNPKNLTIRLGAYRIKDMSEDQTVDIPVSMFIVHKEYSMPRPFSNDIAMLKMVEPVEFSDYIVPICLPTEDLISTATSSMVINDYTNKFETRGKPQDEMTGIVISTKMSDTDIAQCFTRLEQNYLNSIGMGLGGETSHTSTVRPPKLEAPNHLALAQNSHLVGDLITLASQHARPSGYASLNSFPNELPDLSGAYEHERPGHQDNYAVQGDLPWTVGAQRRVSPAIKLSRLPISKELLHEIQSVGSMPSLNLGPQRDDFLAMASDLTRNTANGNLPVNHGYQREKITNFHNVNNLIAKPDLLDVDSSQEASNDDPTRYSGLSGIVVGWGWVREVDSDGDSTINKSFQSSTLQKVRLPILRNSVCEAWFQSQSKRITLLPSQFCAGLNSGGKDACRGDSGGPMIIEDNSDSGRYKLIGIVSAGIGCARPSLPGLYTRVASFLPWINTQMSRY